MVVFINLVVSLLLLLSWACINDAQVEDAIIGGNDAYPGQFPSAVSIQYNRSHYCAGSIISTTWIMCSANCFQYPSTLEAYTILAGTNTLNSGGARRNVSQIIIHPEFVTIATNDIALARLDRPLVPCSRIRPISITNVDTPVGTNVTFSGWGTTSYNENMTDFVYSNNLRTINTTTVSNEDCASATGVDVTANHLCALSAGVGACVGDFGGALIDLATGRQVGIESEIFPCALEGVPDIYTRVFNYRDWIANNTGLTLT